MTGGLRFPELCAPAVGRQPALMLRPWRAADIPALAAEMSREYPTAGMWPGPGERPVRTALPGGAERRAGPAGERDAARWLASQDRGWRDGDRLSFAVLEADDIGGCVLAGNAGLKNREETGRIGERETAEIGCWTAAAARGRGIGPAAVRAVTDWVFDAFAGASLRQIMLVHDVGNPASCRVAEKAGYPFRELSPANPPHWFTDGHIHMRLGGRPGPAAGAQRGTTLTIRPGTTASRSTVSPVICLTQRSSAVTSCSISPAAGGPYPEAIGGVTVVDVPSREEALEWAAKIAAACPRNRMVAMWADGVSEGPRLRMEVCVCVYSPVQASPISVPPGFLDALEPGFVDLLAANHEADGPTERGPGQRGESARPQIATHRRRGRANRRGWRCP